MLFVFLLSDCKYLLYFWLRECLKVLFIIQSINMLESINNLHTLRVSSRSFWQLMMWSREAPGEHHLPWARRAAATTGFCPPVSAGPQVLALPPHSQSVHGGSGWKLTPCRGAVPSSASIPSCPMGAQVGCHRRDILGILELCSPGKRFCSQGWSHIPPFSPDPLLPPCQAPNDGRNAKPGAEPYGSTQLALQTVT